MLLQDVLEMRGAIAYEAAVPELDERVKVEKNAQRCQAQCRPWPRTNLLRLFRCCTMHM